MFEIQLGNFAPIRKMLQIESGLKIFEQSSSSAVQFNELDVLQLIPVIIKKLKERSINEPDQKILKTIYGVLWQLIAEEAERADTEAMNPVLKELLNAQQIQLEKRQNRQYENDVERNTVQRIVRGDDKIKPRAPVPAAAAIRLMKLKMRKDISPAQRLLKFSALLIHESVVRKQQQQKEQQQQQQQQQLKSPRKLRIHKKQLSHSMTTASTSTNNKSDRSDEIDDTVILDINLNRVNKPERRHRRQIQENNDDDDEDTNEIEMNLLRSMIGPEDDGEDDEYDSNAISAENDLPTRTLNDKAKTAYTSAKSINQEYMDYAFDVSDTDASAEEEQLLRAYYAPRTLSSSFDDDDYGSFSELMQLAAKHHLRAQRDNNYLKRLHVDDYLNDEMEY